MIFSILRLLICTKRFTTFTVRRIQLFIKYKRKSNFKHNILKYIVYYWPNIIFIFDRCYLKRLQNYMHPSKLLPNKSKDSSLSKIKKIGSTNQKMGVPIDLFSNPNHQNEGLAVTNQKKIFNAQNHNELKPKAVSLSKERIQITPNNKIYNAKNLPKHSEHLNKSTFVTLQEYQPRQANQSKISHNKAQIRPQSSNPEKYPLRLEAQRFNKEQDAQQLRPGSSKSSRLFKKKSVLVQDRLQSQNDELDDVFIKINSKPSESQNMGSLRERQRIGTSISKKMRGMDKFQAKLDPQFFNLFAS